MDIPFRDIRLVYLRLIADLLHNSHRAYYPDLRFIEAVEATLISNAIFIAEAEGKPLTAAGLAKHLDIPRATLLRRLAYLKSKGFLRSNGRRLRIDMAILSSSAHAENLPRACRIILDAAQELSKLDAPR